MERQPQRRRRPALSCLECRRRKIKCDRNDPCTHCVSAKLRCAFKFYSNGPATSLQGSSWSSMSSPSVRATSPQDRAHQISTNRAIVQEDTRSSLPQDTPTVSTAPSAPAARAAFAAAAVAAGQTDIPNALGRNNIRPTSRTQDGESNLQESPHRGDNIEQAAPSNPFQGLSETGRNIVTRQSGIQNSQIVLNKTRLLRWSDWMGMAREVQPPSKYVLEPFADFLTSSHLSIPATLSLSATATVPRPFAVKQTD